MNLEDRRCVDHKDFNTLNNRKENLRVCTIRENSLHRRNQVNNQSGYNGVYEMTYPSGRVRWRAFTKVNGKYTNLGEFKTFEEAVRVRKKYEETNLGEFQPVATAG